MASPLLERRNQRARAKGWTSYGQRRYWLARFGTTRAQEARTAIELALRIDSTNKPGTVDPATGEVSEGTNGVGSWMDEAQTEFVGSYFSYWTRDRVNNPEHNPDRRDPPGPYRKGEWQARLVSLAGKKKG